MADLKETPEQTIQRLTAELAAANQQIADFQAQAEQVSKDEVTIREKMQHGLTREQAQSVLRNQRAHDALEATKAKAAKEAAKAAK